MLDTVVQVPFLYCPQCRRWKPVRSRRTHFCSNRCRNRWRTLNPMAPLPLPEMTIISYDDQLLVEIDRVHKGVRSPDTLDVSRFHPIEESPLAGYAARQR